jgi:hypothetical protein
MNDIDPVARINELRLKITSGEEITREESAEAVRLLRAQRQRSVTPTKEAKIPLNLNELFKS